MNAPEPFAREALSLHRASCDVHSAPTIRMAARDVDPVWQKKKTKGADSTRLKGYTVGSLAPPGSVSSGNIAVYGYGIDNRYGGNKGKKKAASVSSGSSTSSSGGQQGAGLFLALALAVGAVASYVK